MNDDSPHTEESHSSVFSGEEIHESFLPQSIRLKLESIISKTDKYGKEPTNLRVYAGKNNNLLRLIDDFSVILSSNDSITFTKEEKNKLLSGINTVLCTLVDHVNELSEKRILDAGKSTNDEINSLRTRNTELEQANEEYKITISKHERNIYQLNGQITNLKGIIEDQRTEIDNHIQDYELLKVKMQQSKKNYEQHIEELKKSNDDLLSENCMIKDKYQQTEFAFKREKLTSKTTEQELAKLAEEMSNVKLKLASRSKKLTDARDRISQLELSIKKSEADQQKLYVITNEYKARLSKAKGEIQNYKDICDKSTINNTTKSLETALEEISAQFENQMTELNTLTSESQKMQKIIRKQLDLITYYDERYGNLKMELEGHLEEKFIMKRENSFLNNQVEVLSKKIKETELYGGKSNILNEVCRILDVDESEIIPTIQELLSESKNPELVSMNSRLIAMSQSQLKYTWDVIHNHELVVSNHNASKVNSITVNNATNSPMNSRSTRSNLADLDLDLYGESLEENHASLANQLDVSISRIRNFIQQNKFKDIEIQPEDQHSLIERIYMSEDLIDKEVFNYFCIQVQQNELLLKKYNNLSDEINDITEELQILANEMNYIGPVRRLPAVILDKIRSLDSAYNKMKSILRLPESENMVNDLVDWVIEAQRTLNIFDKSLRMNLEYNGDLSEMPQYLIEYIDNLKGKYEADLPQNDNGDNSTSGNNRRTNELKSNDDNVCSEVQSELLVKDKEITDLNSQINDLKIQLETRSQELDDKNQKCKNLKGKVDELSGTIVELEERIHLLENECKRFRSNIQEREKEYESKIKKALEAEKKIYDEEIEKVNSKYSSELSRMNNEIQEKSDKLSILKNKYDDVLGQYQSVMKEHKDNYHAVKQQNDALNKTITKLQLQLQEPNETHRAEKLNLENQLRILRSEKLTLIAKLQKVEERAFNAKFVADDIARSKLAEREEELQNELKSKVKVISKKHQQFLDDLFDIIAPAEDKSQIITISEDMVLSAAAQLKSKYEGITAAIANSNSSIQSEKSIKEVNTQLREWDRWARDLFVSLCNSYAPGKTSKEIRFILGEMITAGSGHSQLVRKLENLRSQKIILIKHGLISEENATNPPLKSILIPVIFTCRVKKYLHIVQ